MLLLHNIEKKLKAISLVWWQITERESPKEKNSDEII
jgi:hypothetical protein